MNIPPATKSTLIALLAGASILVACCFVGSTVEAKIVSGALCILGLALGWLFGTIGTPYNRFEEKLFASYIKMITTFVSGFLVAKADPILKAFFTMSTVSDQLVLFRVIVFSISFILSLMTVFIWRMYVYTVADRYDQTASDKKPVA